jgi:SAM-dependent methyltransferase
MSDAASWDERYRVTEFVWATEPNRFLPPAIDGLPPGRALDLACGEGRNAVWLATQGWDATGVDFSATGLGKAAQLAETNEVTVEWIRADVTTWTSIERFDLVVVFYLQLPEPARRAAFATAARCLAPGGTLLIVGHDLANLTDGVGGPQNADVLYTPDDIRRDLERGGCHRSRRGAGRAGRAAGRGRDRHRDGHRLACARPLRTVSTIVVLGAGCWVLGAGTGGTLIANRLRRRYRDEQMAITVVGQDDHHIDQPLET